MAVITRIIMWKPPVEPDHLDAPESARECLRRCWTKRPRPPMMSLLGILTASLTRPRTRLSVDTAITPSVTVVVEPAPPLPPRPANLRSRELGLRCRFFDLWNKLLSNSRTSSYSKHSDAQAGLLGIAKGHSFTRVFTKQSINLHRDLRDFRSRQRMCWLWQKGSCV